MSRPGRSTRQNPRPGDGHNRWTHDQRLTLHLIHVRFAFTLTQRAKIFNAIFAEQLRRCGVVGGLSKTRLAAQYAERLKTSESAKTTWEKICQEASMEAERTKRDLIVEQIERVARGLGIVVSRSSNGLSAPRQSAREDGLSAGAKRGRSARFSSVEHGRNDLQFEDFENRNMLTPTPKRVKRTTAQFSKWTFDSSNAVEAKQDTDSDNDFVSEHTLQQKKASRSSPEVVIPVTPKRRGRPRKSNTVASVSLSPRTPTSRSGPGVRKPDAVIPYRYPSGKVIYLTDAELKETERDLVPVAENVAHPPLAGLLFRYWNDDCQSKLNDNGEFIAGRFATTLIPPPPAPSMQNFPWSDAAVHLNRDKIASPFVSASNSLAWIIRLAIKEKSRGVKNSRITLIDPHQMNPRSIFHAQPFHDALCKKRPFEDAAFIYHGKQEFMIYHKVPARAILSTFTVDHFFRLVLSDAALNSVLRLDKLSAGRCYARFILPELKADSVKLDTTSVTAIARLTQFLGLGMDSPAEQVMHLVSDVLQGWAITVAHQTPGQWSCMADTFAIAMQTSRASTGLKDFQKMKLAFLDGVRWSRGDFNARHGAEKMRIMLLRAKKIGLEDPARILRDELDAAKLTIGLYDQKQQRMLQGGGNVGLLEEEEEEDVMLPLTPTSGRMRIDDDILYDTDED